MSKRRSETGAGMSDALSAAMSMASSAAPPIVYDDYPSIGPRAKEVARLREVARLHQSSEASAMATFARGESVDMLAVRKEARELVEKESSVPHREGYADKVALRDFAYGIIKADIALRRFKEACLLARHEGVSLDVLRETVEGVFARRRKADTTDDDREVEPSGPVP